MCGSSILEQQIINKWVTDKKKKIEKTFCKLGLVTAIKIIKPNVAPSGGNLYMGWQNFLTSISRFSFYIRDAVTHNHWQMSKSAHIEACQRVLINRYNLSTHPPTKLHNSQYRGRLRLLRNVKSIDMKRYFAKRMYILLLLLLRES